MSSVQEQAFWSRVKTAGPDECWEWQGFCVASYGQVPFVWESRRAHRYSYYLNIDKNFNRSLQVCHRCDNPPCVNPKHLFLDTQKGNSQDMSRKGRARNQSNTHCKNGHEFNKVNTYICKDKRRHCRVCNKKNKKKKREQTKELAVC